MMIAAGISPFFFTKRNKPRVVFDGAATCGGVALNDAVFAGTNLLNSLKLHPFVSSPANVGTR